jgi:hypothetical protein
LDEAHAAYRRAVVLKPDCAKAYSNRGDALREHGQLAEAVDACRRAETLGKPVWLLASHVADWRWPLGRENNPWYPALRVFLQPGAGRWPETIARLADCLTRYGR